MFAFSHISIWTKSIQDVGGVILFSFIWKEGSSREEEATSTQLSYIACLFVCLMFFSPTAGAA